MELRRSALARIEQDDEEQLQAVIRREHHAQMFRILAQDLMGYLTVQEVGDELSALADAVLRLCALWVWQRLNPTWVGELPLAVIGYGKLGSQELGYGSDLDLVLLFDDSSAVTPEQVTKMARQ
jgi:glutamate-ammonia-ligase adenylyltransferase